MRLCAVGDDVGRDAEVRRVEGQNALDMGEHERIGWRRRPSRGDGLGRGGRVGRGGRKRRAGRRVRDGRFGGDGEQRVGRDYAAHGVPDEDDSHRGIDGRRRGACGDLEVNDHILQPGRR